MKDPTDNRTAELPGHSVKYGYARVSTDDQTLDSQLDCLRRAGVSQIYQEHASGKQTNRPELEHAIKALRAGDTLVVWRLDRLGRSLPHLVATVAELQERGIGFESLTEKIDTTSASGKLMFHVFAALAEFERDLIRERTHEGLKAARARGRNGGRPAKLSPADIKQVRTLMADRSTSARQVAQRFGVARSTIYAALRNS